VGRAREQDPTRVQVLTLAVKRERARRSMRMEPHRTRVTTSKGRPMSADTSFQKSSIGVEVKGIDFSKPLSDEDLRALKTMLHQHSVIFLREQTMDRDQYVENAK